MTAEPLDARAVRLSVASGTALPDDPTMTVSPEPLAVRPLRNSLAETGPLGGIRAAAGEEAGNSGEEAGNGGEDAVLVVDGRRTRVRLTPIDARHAVLEYAITAGADDDAASVPLEPTEAADQSASDGRQAPIRRRVLLGPASRRRSDGVLVQEAVVDGWRFELELESERWASLRERARRGHESTGHAGPLEIHAIIPGRIAAISVSAGDPVEAGQQLLVVEAMKMQNELRAPREGEIQSILVAVGQTIDVGDVLMVLS